MATVQTSTHVIGVYPIPITKESLLESGRIDPGEGSFNLDDVLELSDEEFAERFENIYLVEIEVDSLNVDFGKFTQEEPGLEPANWQVPWDEKFLDRDGSSIIPAPSSAVGSARAAFFFHYIKFDRPLLTPYGPVDLPAPTTLPARLANLFYYFPP